MASSGQEVVSSGLTLLGAGADWPSVLEEEGGHHRMQIHITCPQSPLLGVVPLVIFRQCCLGQSRARNGISDFPCRSS